MRPSARIALRPPGDAYEREANRVTTQILRNRASVRERRPSDPHASGETAPPIVERAVGSSGRPLDRATRSFMESRLGADLADVRVHTDSEAAESARAVRSLAYTVGRDVVFAAGAYAPTTLDGRLLLAHELAHVVQQGRAPGDRLLQRFEVGEKDKIAATYQDMLRQVRALVDAATVSDPFGDGVNMDYLVEIAGGNSFARGLGRKIDESVIGKKKGEKSVEPATIKSQLYTRYLFTCRCGLIDMRHFFQLFYLTNFYESTAPGGDAIRAATAKGREHELTAPDTQSRFAPEDTPSNALGALAGHNLPALNPLVHFVLDAITDTLSLCDPVDFGKLSKQSQDAIVNFYGGQVPDPKHAGHTLPKHPNETALPDVLDIPECRGRERSFPFGLDTDDPDRKTIEDRSFKGGAAAAKTGREIRDFVARQRAEVISLLPTDEKVRMVKVLLSDDVSDDDRAAAEVIEKNSTPDELERELDAVHPMIRPLPAPVLHVEVPPRNYDAILVPLLERRFRSEDVAAYAARLARLKTFFGQLEPADARRLRARLEVRRPGDRLSEAFHDVLSTAARRELLAILDR
jgi:uncharacterized protein DUF4157